MNLLLSDSSDSFLEELIDEYCLNDNDIVYLQTIKPRTMINERQYITKENYWLNSFPSFPENAFVKKYRMRRASFNQIAEQYFEQSNLNYENDWKLCLALTIEYLSCRSRQFDLSVLYGVSVGKVNEHISRGVYVLAVFLTEDVVTWPNEEERALIAQRHHSRWDMPMCIGAIDGTLVRTKGYQPNKTELNTRKCHYGFNVLLLCDDSALVRYYVAGSCGSLSDSTIFENTNLYNQLNTKLFNSNRVTHNYYVISDKGIPNTDFIVTPFVDDGNLSAQQIRFNNKLQSARQIVERTDMFLKLRYQAIRETITAVREDKAIQMVTACIGLHNFSIISGILL